MMNARSHHDAAKPFLRTLLPVIFTATLLGITSIASAQIQSVPTTLTVSPTTAIPGEPLTVSWTAPPGSSTSDWIGLYDLYAPNTEYRCVIWTGGAESGSVKCVDAVNLGRFQFRYLTNNSYTSVAASNTVTIEPPSGFTLSLSDSITFGNGEITVNWTAPAGRPATDWIGLFRHGEPDNHAYDWNRWVYTGGATSGNHTFRMPTVPGEYVFRYLVRDVYVDVSESAIVTVSPFSVTVGAKWIYMGAPLSVSFTAPAGQTMGDWIGLFRVGDSDSAYLSVDFTKGATSGTIKKVFNMPAGKYEYRYFIDNGFMAAAVSNPFEVYSPVGFEVESLTNSAAPGELVTVNWAAPTGRTASDWIGLFLVGSGNRQWIQYVYTGGAAVGSATFRMPAFTGDFEFRYLYADGYVDFARSGIVSVR